MNKLIKKIAVLGIALTLITGAFTGCKGNNAATTTTATTAVLPSYTSVKDPSGELPAEGKVGDIEYKILTKDQYGNAAVKDRGYYVDQLEQLDSPYFIVVTSGKRVNEGYDIKIVDLGMQDSKLVIVVEDTIGDDDEFTGFNTPCATLMVDHDHMPSEFIVVTTTGEVLGPVPELMG